MITIYIYLSTNTDDVYFFAFSSCHLAKKMTTVLAGCHRGELFFGLTPADFPFAWLACEQTRLLFTICPKWRASSHAFPFLVLLIIVCEQALLFGRTKRAAREHASERAPLACLSRIYFSLYPPNGELARRLLFVPL